VISLKQYSSLKDYSPAEQKAIRKEVHKIQFHTGQVDFLFGAYNSEIAQAFNAYQLGWDYEAVRDHGKPQNTIACVEVHYVD